MSKSDAFENQFLLHLFQNAAIANVGDGTGLDAAGTVGSLYIRLCDTSACTDATVGTELTYTGYVQYGVAVARTSGGWTVAANNATNTAAITFGACTVGTVTVRFFEIWKTNVDATAANRLYWGQLTSDLAVSPGITPEFAISALDVNED